ncbi:uncharacterized protein E0L32_008550 [Thyridium curvatum]|uniref:Pentatricopeptide repeat protein n=1 Tax=Thyridium curvatum TaxID=1093900 RepID=A0A507B1R9_9PEZI|nr:uncharacterized protein E0L32_008550 [Thyridium curvatum]TPX10500.1 hypothetical protein E0L32_008550 [Thyridium curvatum]
MPGSRVVIDGLWRCLCPSFDLSCLRVAEHSATREIPYRAGSLRLRSNRIQARPFHQTAVRHEYHNIPNGEPDHSGKQSDRTSPLLKAKDRQSETHALRSTPVPIIYDALRELQELPGSARRINRFVKHLIEERGEKPSLRTYELLLRANAAVRGSADDVRELLKQMRENGVDGSSSVYHAALEALAVHPDYLLRNSVIKEMRDRWIEIAPEGWHSVVVGLLRDGQYEMALDKLEDLQKAHVGIPDWLYDIFVYTFGQMGFLDEALQMVNHRLQKETGDVSLNVWHFLLEVCSSGYHHEGTKYVWNRMVQPKLLVPSDGTVTNVLNTAARAGDPKLADQATQYLVSRGTKLGVHHFEALLECYAVASDIDKALHGLCIMRQAGIPIGRGSTRPVYRALRRYPSLVEPAVKTLFDLAGKFAVPIAAFNVVLEGMLAVEDGAGQQAQQEHALDLYRHVRQVCPEQGPDITTFHVLLQRWEGAGDARVVDFLASEMESFGIRPDGQVLDALVRIAVLHGADLDLAMRYVFRLVETDMSVAGGGDAAPWIGEDTAVLLVKRCLNDEDARLWDLLEACRARGMDLDWVVRAGGVVADEGHPEEAPHKKENWPGEFGQHRQERDTGLEDEPLHASLL